MPVPSPSAPLLGPYSYTPFPIHGTHRPITFSDTQFPDTVNPLFAGSPVDFEVLPALWARPVFYDQQFHVHADQLTQVPLPDNGDVRDNGQTITMHLRHDLRWSDGQPILASDFSYWWRLNQNPDTGALITYGYDQIASIDTPDDFTVILHMKHPFGPYLSYLPYAAPQHAWKVIKPLDLQNTFTVFQAPNVTSGPYMLTAYRNGPHGQNGQSEQSYTMRPNPYYRSTTFHGPFASQLLFRTYPDTVALGKATRQGKTDVSEGYTENDLPSLASLSSLSSSVHLLSPAAAAYEHLDFNLTNPDLQDARVRRAIQMAINVCTILQNALHTSDCSRAISQVEPPPSLVYDSRIQQSKYDPVAAKKLLAQAGWLPATSGMLSRNGHPFTLRLLTTSANPLRTAIAHAIQQALHAAGIRVTITTYPFNQFFAVYTRGGILATGAYAMALFSYANNAEPNNEYNVFASSQIPSASNPDGGNYGHITDPIIDQSLARGRDTVLFKDRVHYYHQFLERVAAQVYLIPFFTDVNLMTVSNRIQNVLPNADASNNNWNISDWWAR